MPLRLQQALCLYAAITENPTCTGVGVFSSEGIEYSAAVCWASTIPNSLKNAPAGFDFVIAFVFDYGDYSTNSTFVKKKIHQAETDDREGENFLSPYNQKMNYLSPRIASDCSFILYFCILPAAFMGKSSTIIKYLGTLCFAMWSRM